MPVPSAAQLSRLRDRPHRGRLWLSIYEPQAVASARINMPAIAKAERGLTVTWLSGSASVVDPDMTVYIGTTPGANDKGRLRVRSASGNTLTVAENAVAWVNGWYVTVAAYWEPWSIFNRIELPASNIPIFYEDYDILWAGQTEAMDPVINMGPNHAAFLDEATGLARVYYTASGTYDPSDGGSSPTSTGSMTFAWNFDYLGGGPISPSGSAFHTPGYVDYTGAGFFVTELEVGTPAGGSYKAYRHIAVYDRPNRGPEMPILKWGFSSLSGSRDEGGYGLDLWVREQVGFSRVRDGSLIVIWSEDWEGGSAGKVGGNALNRDTIFFVGYVEGDSIEWEPFTNRVTFRAVSISGIMKRLAAFSATLESKQTPSSWTEMQRMTIDRAIAHYLRWRSTILAVADFHPTSDTLPVQYADFDRSNVYDASNGLYESALGARMVTDRQGGLWAEVDLNLMPTGAFRHPEEPLSLTEQDWRERIDIERAPYTAMSYMEGGGIAYAGPDTGTFAPLLAGAPGVAPNYAGDVERISGLVLQSRAQLNRLVGLMLARENAEFPEVAVPMAGDYRLIDIAPQQRVRVTMSAADNYRRLEWAGKAFVPFEVSYRYEAEAQIILMDLRLREETEGPAGDSIEIPIEPPFDDPGLPDWDIDFPPFQPWVPPFFPVELPPGNGNTVFVVEGTRVSRTRNFFEGAVECTWQAVPLAGTVIGDSGTGTINSFRLDPANPTNTALMNVQVSTGGDAGIGSYIYLTQNLDAATPAWTTIMTPMQWRTLVSGNNQALIRDMSFSPLQRGFYWLCGRRQSIGAASAAAYTTNYGASWQLCPGVFGNQSAQTTMLGIQASWKSVAQAYCSEFSAANVNPLVKTTNFGVSWAAWGPTTGSAITTDFHIPTNGNDGDTIAIFSLGQGAGKRLWRTLDAGTTKVEISPMFAGQRYAATRPAPSSGSWHRIKTHPTNGQKVLAALNPAIAESGDADGTILFTSTNLGLSFLPLRSFVRGVTNLEWHPTNIDIFYLLIRFNALSNPDGYILATEDGGATFTNRQFSYERDILGGPFSAAWSPVDIICTGD